MRWRRLYYVAIVVSGENILTVALLILAVIVAAILGYAATRPDSFRVERTITINAPAEKIFALINDFREWRAWSPWEDKDPALKRDYSGAVSGVGSLYRWEGNNQVGKGTMEILEAPAPAKVVIKLDFEKPFEGHNTAEFTLSSLGGATTVTWAMFGASPFMMKVMGIFMNMDTMVGRDFETGLARMKTAAER